ncbi:MAG: DNA translocase FtsK [Firmicutes bacterium]|nr:DNA translocase FtsK [Bacillota bacterium]
MAVARQKRSKPEKKPCIFDGIKKEVGSVVIIALAILIWWNLYFPPDGKFSILINKTLRLTFGSLAGFFPLILVFGSLAVIFKSFWKQPRGRTESVLVLYIGVLGLWHWLLPIESVRGAVPWAEFFEYARLGSGGGYIGAIITGLIWWAAGKIGTLIILILIMTVALLGIGRRPLLDKLKQFIGFLFSRKKKNSEKEYEKKAEPIKPKEKAAKFDKKKKIFRKRTKKQEVKEEELEDIPNTHTLKKAENENDIASRCPKGRPTIDILLDPIRDEDQTQEDRSDLLEKTLRSFNVETTISGYICGPTLTRYEVIPGAGVKVKQIENLADDIALALAARSVRIEAPIPGKRAVGIEVPNETPGTVYLKEVLDNPSFLNSASPLTIGFGKDIGGASVISDLNKLIHLLVAGATGSGKSVCINAMLASLLIKASPEELRLILIDPKRVELALYEGIPHLLTPVVTDPREAAKALRWAVMEMEERYVAFEEVRVRDLKGYNEKAKKEGKEVLPRIVIIIDELADLMMVASAEVEEAICRLAQKARAAGMHLIVATQRPSTDVVTGLIKANIPSRIAFAVSSGTDSSIILDTRGAERLLGKGDMLFYPIGLAKPVRLQGAYVSDKEVELLVECWKAQGDPDYIDMKVAEQAQNASVEARDELLPQAAQIVVENDRASASFLQRHLRIGYTRAARLIDIMESLGIVGPHQGSKPRDILVSESELHDKLSNL